METMAAEAKSKSVRIEDVLEDIGGYGRFQKIFTWISVYPELAAAMIILSPVFTGSNNSHADCNVNKTIVELPIASTYCGDNCTNLDQHDVTSIVQEWDLVCSRSWIVELITSCQMVGMMLGAMTSSLIADRFGRNPAGLLFARCGMGVLGSLPAISNSPGVYAFTRFLAGFGMGGCFAVGMVHFMEFLTPSWRSICGAVSLWPIGEMLLALLAYLIPSWRYLTVATAIPTFFVLLLYPFILESPQWLLTRKRTKDAYKIFHKIASTNRKPTPEYSTIEALQLTVLQEEANALHGCQGIRQIWRDKSLRMHMAILAWANITNSVVYYGLSFSAKSLSGSPYWNMFYMGLEDFVAIPATLLLSNPIGRKKTFLFYVALATMSLGTALVMTAKDDLALAYPLVVTIAAHIGRFAVVSSWGALNCLIMESFPTAVRSTSLGFTAFVGYMAAIVAPQTILLAKISPCIPYILYCGFTLTSCIFSLFLDDMAGIPLKDVVPAPSEILSPESKNNGNGHA